MQSAAAASRKPFFTPHINCGAAACSVSPECTNQHLFMRCFTAVAENGIVKTKFSPTQFKNVVFLYQARKLIFTHGK